jgi:phosphoribosylamine--glycine ligase
MRTLVIDGGARGQAIGEKLANEGHQVFMSPGGPGNENFAHSTGLDVTDIEGNVLFSRHNRVEIATATEDLPLAMGTGDAFAEVGISFFGPTQAQARIESDREWAKGLGRQHKVPMGAYSSFTTPEEALEYASNRRWPLYAKQNGLARGKGARRCEDIEELADHTQELAQDGLISGDSPLVIEDYIEGPEASVHAFCDGLNHLMVPFLVRDHKTIGEGNTGPMTGGVGVIGPLSGYTPEDIAQIGTDFVEPIVHSLGFRGLLFPGLKAGQCLEWNARPGDPEFQLILKLLQSDLMPILLASATGTLDKLEPPKWETNKFGINLVLAAEGYPGEPRRGEVIEGLEKVGQDIQVIQAATRRRGTDLVTNGGRILNLLTLAEDQKTAVERVYKAAGQITFGGRPAVFRKDIGR